MRKNFLYLRGSKESFLVSKKDILWVSVKTTRESDDSFTVESKYFLRNDRPSQITTFEPGTYYTTSTEHEQRESFSLTEKISSEKMTELKSKFGKDLGVQELCTMMILERLEER